MNRLGKYLSFVLILVVILSIPVNAQEKKANIIVDGAGADIKTILKNDRIFVPVETLGEKLDFDVEYRDNQIDIIKENTNISLTINSNKVMVNDEELVSDVNPFLQDDDIFVPVRLVAEGIGKEVIWDGSNYNVLIGEFNREARIEDTFIYFNEEYGYTLSFPNSWKDEAIIETKDGILYVYDKKSSERFMEDGYEIYGPVFEIRCSDYSIAAGLTYEDDYVLYYNDGKYIEALFGSDFQFYPETVDSYTKIYDKGLNVLGSFRKINEDSGIVVDDRDNYEREITVLYDILENYVPQNIFNRDEIFTYKKPVPNSSFLYMRNMKNEDEVSIKIESEFDKGANLIRYHLKNYKHELEESNLPQDEAMKLANGFINRYVNEDIELRKIPDLYPSLYEEGKHETYGDEEGKYIVVVDLVHGFVEYFSLHLS